MSDEGSPIDSAEDANAQLVGADDADLFGSGSEDEETSSKPRKIDDEDVDSGDDEGCHDRAEDRLSETREALQTREENVLDISIGRHAIPHPSDGELYLLKFPSSLGIEPKAFTPSDWKPPTSEHHTAEPSSTFSAYNTSNNTIRWRHSPNNPKEIQSNARLLRWSDGSFTIQVASNSREQFALSAKGLAPPQVDPPKPTPTSVKRSQVAGKPAYEARFDTHTYLASTHEAVSLLQITNHVTTALAVQSYSEQDDDATIKLQESMAAAIKGHKGAEGGVGIMHITEDPELAKKKAEVAEKEKARATRRRQLQEEKERERSNRVLGRSGLGRAGGYGGGLTIGGLEDDDGMARPKARPSKPKSKKPRRRNSEYSDEEEFMTRGRTREDEYDEDDDFLVRDDEPELVADESEEEEDIDMEAERPSKKSSKREPPAAAAAEEAEAPATADSPVNRAKRRRVIDDEDEDE